MIQIDMPMPKNCLECRFSWAGDSCTYCIAQCYHKPEGGFHLHKIMHTYHSRKEQEIWREASCPLIARESRVMSAAEVADCQEGTVLWVEERQGVTWNLFPMEIETSSTHPDTGTDYLFFIAYHDIRKYECSEYNRTWRCWTSRPTDEQREATAWPI